MSLSGLGRVLHRASRLIIYPWAAFFAIYQNTHGVPSTSSLASLFSDGWVARWAVLVNIGATLGLLGSLTATRARYALTNSVTPHALEGAGALLLAVCMCLYHFAIIRERGATAVPTTQMFVGITWTYAGLRFGALAIYVTEALRARRRVAAVLSSAHGDAPQDG